MQKIILPKKHLSWSQLDLWRRDKKRYRSQYYENGRKLNTRYLEFGKGVASMIEDGTYKSLFPGLHIYEKVEHPIRVMFQGVELFGKLDSYDPETCAFDEYKTGKAGKDGKPAWDKAKVQKHDQLLFYAVLVELACGMCPAHCDLYWLETKEGAGDPDDFWARADRKIALTGRIVPFRRQFDKREVDRMKAEILRVAQEISKDYQEFILEL